VSDERELAEAVNTNGKNSTSVKSLHPASPGDNLNPALRSWIENVMVPILIGDYLEERKRKSTNEHTAHSLDSRAKIVRDCLQQYVPSSGRLT
jgi:hypothetical protein